MGKSEVFTSQVKSSHSCFQVKSLAKSSHPKNSQVKSKSDLTWLDLTQRWASQRFFQVKSSQVLERKFQVKSSQVIRENFSSLKSSQVIRRRPQVKSSQVKSDLTCFKSDSTM